MNIDVTWISWDHVFLSLALFTPLASFLALAAAQIWNVEVAESRVKRLIIINSVSVVAGIGSLATKLVLLQPEGFAIDFGDWFHIGPYAFELHFFVDWPAIMLAMLSALLTGVVGAFSSSYLHKDEGFARFFLMFFLFELGIVAIAFAGNIDILFGGWELLGLTSALLIAYFHRREGPVKNALFAFGIYRLCDVFLLIAAVLFHHWGIAAAFAGVGEHDLQTVVLKLSETQVGVLATLLIVSAMGKSASVPFSGWLPRAMEGPTPSSAIFYGALSIHAGVFLLLRAAPLIDASLLAQVLLIVIGALTAVHGTFVGRVQVDAKNTLAYASLTQVGVMFIGLGLGLYTLVLAHLVGHALVRSLQLLRAPSLLHDHHRTESAWGELLPRPGRHFERLLPAGIQNRLYALALQRGGHDELLDSFLIRPLLLLARTVDAVDLAFERKFEPRDRSPSPNDIGGAP